jgi:hypothetical protein
VVPLQSEIHPSLEACSFFLAHLNIGDDITSHASTPDRALVDYDGLDQKFDHPPSFRQDAGIQRHGRQPSATLVVAGALAHSAAVVPTASFPSLGLGPGILPGRRPAVTLTV